MAEWNDEYYERKEREHLELVKCWAFACLIGLAVAAVVGLVMGVAALVRWLLGGA